MQYQLADLFESVADAVPDREAVVYGDRRLTFREMDERGEPVVGDTLFVILNGGYEPVSFMLPRTSGGLVWERLLDTDGHVEPVQIAGHHKYKLTDRAVVVFRTRPKVEREPDVTPLQAETPRKVPRKRRALPAG